MSIQLIPICCWIGCENAATKRIWYSMRPDDYTETCDLHEDDFRDEGDSVEQLKKPA